MSGSGSTSLDEVADQGLLAKGDYTELMDASTGRVAGTYMYFDLAFQSVLSMQLIVCAVLTCLHVVRFSLNNIYYAYSRLLIPHILFLPHQQHLIYWVVRYYNRLGA